MADQKTNRQYRQVQEPLETIVSQPEPIGPADSRDVAAIKRNPIITTDPIENLLDTGRFEQIQRVAQVMASASLVPKHLQNQISDCILVINQAIKRRMDPFDLAQVTHVVSGKIGYEGKAIAAWVNDDPRMVGSLRYVYEGENDGRTVKVVGRLKGEDEDRFIVGSLSDWQTANVHWKKSPDQLLAYRGAREWARRHTPEIVLGIYTPDELEEGVGPDNARDVTPAPQRAEFIEVENPAPVSQTDTPEPDVPATPTPAAEEEPIYLLTSFFGEIIGEFDYNKFWVMFDQELAQAKSSGNTAVKQYLLNNIDTAKSTPGDDFLRYFGDLMAEYNPPAAQGEFPEER